MKITDEMVEDILRQHIKVDATGLSPAVASAFVTGFSEAASALTAALAVQTQQGVGVRKLGWRAYGNQHLKGWQGVGRMGYLAYVTNIGPDGEEGWFFDNRQQFDTADEAKAAAQSDYETRIRSALVDVPAVESEPVAWLRVAKMTPITGDDYKSLWLTNEEDPRGFPVYAHPPRSLSNEGSENERALEFVARWAWHEDPPAAARNLSDRERLSAIKYHPTIKARAALSTRKGSAGDGAATGTKGASE